MVDYLLDFKNFWPFWKQNFEKMNVMVLTFYYMKNFDFEFWNFFEIFKTKFWKILFRKKERNDINNQPYLTFTYQGHIIE